MCRHRKAKKSGRAATVVGLIFAGGRGRRLVKDKGWLAIGGVPIVQRVQEALCPLTPTILVLGEAQMPPEWKLSILPDEIPGAGPLAALYGAMKAQPAELYLAVAWDMPFVTTELLRFLLEACHEDREAVVPHVAGRDQPLCAVYRYSCINAIARALAQGKRQFKAFFPEISLYRAKEAEIASLGDPAILFFNVNTPAEYALAQKLAPKWEK